MGLLDTDVLYSGKIDRDVSRSIVDTLSIPTLICITVSLVPFLYTSWDVLGHFSVGLTNSAVPAFFWAQTATLLTRHCAAEGSRRSGDCGQEQARTPSRALVRFLCACFFSIKTNMRRPRRGGRFFVPCVKDFLLHDRYGLCFGPRCMGCSYCQEALDLLLERWPCQHGPCRAAVRAPCCWTEWCGSGASPAKSLVPHVEEDGVTGRTNPKMSIMEKWRTSTSPSHKAVLLSPILGSWRWR